MWTLQDAKNRFSAVVEAALAGQPQEVSRRGRPAVVVLSSESYRRLLADAVSRRGSFAEHLLTFPGAGPEGPDDDLRAGPEGPDDGLRLRARPRDVTF